MFQQGETRQFELRFLILFSHSHPMHQSLFIALTLLSLASFLYIVCVTSNVESYIKLTLMMMMCRARRAAQDDDVQSQKPRKEVYFIIGSLSDKLRKTLCAHPKIECISQSPILKLATTAISTVAKHRARRVSELLMSPFQLILINSLVDEILVLQILIAFIDCVRTRIYTPFISLYE